MPFEDDPSLGKDRPVVIVGRHGALLSGVALTSKDKDRPDCVDVGTGPWDSRGRPSYAKVDRLLDIDPDEVRREGAILSRRRFDAVIEAVDRLHDVTVEPFCPRRSARTGRFPRTEPGLASAV